MDLPCLVVDMFAAVQTLDAVFEELHWAVANLEVVTGAGKALLDQT